MVCIVILNWNGYRDTIDCLQSLDHSLYDDYFVIIVDNGSTDRSIEMIEDSFLKDGRKYSKTILKKEKSLFQIEKRFVILYELENNYGFSQGNNLALEYASKYHPDYYLLLNNDTIVTPSFLLNLIEFSSSHKNYKALTPLICYFSDKEIIWNGGGDIAWGLRKYHYANKNVNEVKEIGYINCTYITGCALFFMPSLLMSDGHIFCDKFFFGEEDFEFGLRMKKQRYRMACVLDSIIYHKVGRSRKKILSLPYIYYINRLINVRDYYSRLFFFFYKYLIALYIVFLLMKKYRMSFMQSLKFINTVFDEVEKNECVSKELFMKYQNLSK